VPKVVFLVIKDLFFFVFWDGWVVGWVLGQNFHHGRVGLGWIGYLMGWVQEIVDPRTTLVRLLACGLLLVFFIENIIALKR